MRNIGVAMAGGLGNRRHHDSYPTPWQATAALLREVCFPQDLWEPACGDGAICDVLKTHGYQVVGSDLREDGIWPDGVGGFDFLTTRWAPGDFDAIITNPPFKLAVPFIDRALKWRPIVALLLKSNFWHAASRVSLFEKHPPSRVLPLTFRIDVTGQGNPTMDVSWYVWGVAGKPFKPLPKPKRIIGDEPIDATVGR